VKEAMRMVPVSGGTVRVSPDRPVVLGGHTIPAGVQILLAVHGEVATGRGGGGGRGAGHSGSGGTARLGLSAR
jgi:hypothetical protein